MHERNRRVVEPQERVMHLSAAFADTRVAASPLARGCIRPRTCIATLGRVAKMILKRAIGLVFAGALAFSAMAAEIVIRVAPPRMVVERRGRAARRHLQYVHRQQ